MQKERPMDDHSGWSRDLGLQFFGKVSASISHEMKNVLAIINENVGLLEDLAYIADKGQPIDPEKMQRTCLNMTRQIKRGDTIMKNLNTFAHSIDEVEKDIDLYQLVDLVASLASRRAALRSVSFVVQKPGMPVVLQSNPFLLQNFLWLCLEETIEVAQAGSTLSLIVEKGEDCSYIILKGEEEPAYNAGDRVGKNVPAAMLAQLRATVQTKSDGRELLLSLH
jgi:C4-dicarboxylate-specific signal transduction histidine kinase